MSFIAAPIVRQPQSVIGAPGKTDFVRIYIASELNKSEYRTTLRHEQAHVWAAHHRRRPKDAKLDVWAIACEMEIARSIYDSIDIENIKAPRSRLGGGYLPDSIKDMPPRLTLVEDIYEWLLNHPEHQQQSVKCCICDHSEENGDPLGHIDAAMVVKVTRQAMDDEEKARESQAAADAAYAMVRNRTPSLTCAVDAALRVRIERERSHRRPSRRNASEDVLMPGAISRPRPPLVEIFVDRSGSFSPEKTAMAELRLRDILERYGSTIRSDVWFFGNGRLSEVDHGGGGDTPYGLIQKHLEMTKPKLAIVITDDDPVSSEVRANDRRTSVLCVPIGCSRTNLSVALNGIDVAA